MKFKNLLTVATLCVLTLATSVSAHNGERCVRPGGGDGGIQILSAFYGNNCGAHHNVGWSVQSMCGGQQNCWYHVDHNMIGDPAFGCRKDFRVNYFCGDGQVRQAYLSGEASGQTLTLSCN